MNLRTPTQSTAGFVASVEHARTKPLSLGEPLTKAELRAAKTRAELIWLKAKLRRARRGK